MSDRDQFELFLRLLLAAGLGAVVGLERDFRGHDAGLRTSALVALGAALFGEVSRHIGDDRVAAGVVQGVGFLCAGLVFHGGSQIRGITTAATVWVLAGVGLFVAYDLRLTAILVTATIVVVLELAPVSNKINGRGRSHRHRGYSDETPPPANTQG